jgi:hypothetical protein
LKKWKVKYGGGITLFWIWQDMRDVARIEGKNMEIDTKFVQRKKDELCRGSARWGVELNGETTLRYKQF